MKSCHALVVTLLVLWGPRCLASQTAEEQRVASLDFTGFEVLEPSRLRELRERARIKAGDRLDTQVLREMAQAAADALGEAGYAYARIEIRQTAIVKARVAVELHAEPGQVGYFGPIEIVGNSGVNDDVIRRQLAYLPGERFRVSTLRESEQRLSRLGLFESAAIEVLESRTALPEVPTRITVKEADLNQFSYSFGYDSEKQVYGDAQWRHRNVFGGGRSTTVRGRWSWIDRGGEGVFYQPYLFTPRLSLQLSAGAWHVDESAYSVFSAGGTAGLSYLLGRLNRVSATYLHQTERNRVDAFEGEQDGVLAALRLEANRDTTRGAENPRTGYRTMLRVEKGGGWLPGVFVYRNYFTDGRYYTAAGPVTIAGRLQFGTLEAERDSDIPFSSRYFLGGAETLRGWGRQEVSPLSSSGAPIGGRTVFVVNGEARLPVFRRVSGVGFLDAGNVWAQTWELHLGNLRSSAGVGARVVTPFGLVRVDAGYQLTPIQDLRVDGEPQDRRWRIHVSLGQVF